MQDIEDDRDRGAEARRYYGNRGYHMDQNDVTYNLKNDKIDKITFYFLINIVNASDIGNTRKRDYNYSQLSTTYFERICF